MTKKITELDALTAPAIADIIEIVDDVAVTPTSKKIALSDLWKVVNSFTATTSPQDGDYIPIYSSTDGAIRKALKSNLFSGDTFYSAGDIRMVELYNETLSGNGIFDTDGVDLSGYDHLLINLAARSSVSASGDDASVIFNTDSTASNYRRQLLQAYGNNHLAATAAIASIGAVSAATSPANNFGISHMRINNYSGTTFYKYVQTVTDYRDSDAVPVMQVSTLIWQNTGTITRITIQPDGYATDKFITGLYCQIIGIKTVA